MTANASSEDLDDEVINFYDSLFGQIFSEPFQAQIANRLKEKAVLRQVEESADAASQSLIRLFQNERLDSRIASGILCGFEDLADHVGLDDIANPNVTPEELVDSVIADLPCPESVRRAGHDAVYRVALHTILQVLMLVGPVMAEWRKLNFASTFEIPRRVVNRLNQISQQLDALGKAGQEAQDERFELSYRDYLLQRFFRVEAGTVRMTTNLSVDLRELFVMPRVRPRPRSAEDGDEVAQAIDLMDLAAARKAFGDRTPTFVEQEPEEAKDETGELAVEYVKRTARCVLVGLPGAGKSTFLEWFQLQLAAVGEELVLGGAQAIPLLLRVRELDPKHLPKGASLIEAATASKDRATLMPPGWIDRQMAAGRVVFMLDGLDETEPGLLGKYVLPWIEDLLKRYPRCHYLISSRPVGYPPGRLRPLKFDECDLLDFDRAQIEDYTRHWCTSVRLAQNEPEEEARREGSVDGNRIVKGFEDHPHILDLARNPLMLSAICLVNYFEGGELPKDRALLYQLCVEGLLHNWDQRRGIRSEFTLDEKLRVCREVALNMQANDRAEFPAKRIREIFAKVLGDPVRARALLEHVRYRTGVLLERRPQVFGFAHLTFQEYLAARAIHEGNQLGTDAASLVREHGDGRWQEVIALYCGLAPAPVVRAVIDGLIESEDTEMLSRVLGDAYLSSGPEITQDHDLRVKVLRRIAVAPVQFFLPGALARFPPDEVAPIANGSLGKIESQGMISESHHWLFSNPDHFDEGTVMERLSNWPEMTPLQVTEPLHLLCRFGSDEALAGIANDADLYAAPGSRFSTGENYSVQGEIVLIGLSQRPSTHGRTETFDFALLQALRSVVMAKSQLNSTWGFALEQLFGDEGYFPANAEDWSKFADLAGRLERRIRGARHGRDVTRRALHAFAERLEMKIAERDKPSGEAISRSKGKPATKRSAKKKPKGRKAP